jgi:hypothetical protein
MIVEPRLDRIVSAQPYPLIFATISGAHLYGFPSPDSDYESAGRARAAAGKRVEPGCARRDRAGFPRHGGPGDGYCQPRCAQVHWHAAQEKTGTCWSSFFRLSSF